MLTRLYIDNFRCFVNFEYKPARRQLILGGNGTGKSSFMDALLFLRQFVLKGDLLDDHLILSQRTRWLTQPRMTWEMEAAIEGATHLYRLEIEPWGEPPRPRVVSETLQCDRKPIVEFTSGEVRLFDDRFEHKVTYDFDWHRSALATITERKNNQAVARFRRWLGGVYCLRINPFAMASRTEDEHLHTNSDLSNFASWYRHLRQEHPKLDAAMLESLRTALEGFSYLQFESYGERVRLLTAEFGRGTKFHFSELSDGQRCLICLYAILHFVLATGRMVVLDEPENFVSLREIQPWLMAAADTVEEAEGQLLLISHHPEILNQWAPGGVRFVREGAGPVRVVEFHGDPASPLTASELVARGWERE